MISTRWPNAALHKILEKRPRRVGQADTESLQHAVSHYDSHDTVFAHVGLSDVNEALPGDPYETIIDTLDGAFDSVLAPGFTDYFKTSGVYDKRNSAPKHGTFGKLFLNDADYRTNDAMKSILVKGDYRFDGCNHRSSYSTDGCFQQLREDNVLVVSIGTPYLICSYLHHLEARNDVPYMREETYQGVMHDEDGDTTEIEQTTHQYDGIWSFNKLKLQRDLRKNGFFDSFDFSGLRMFVTSIRYVDELVTMKMEDDPYYLVT